MKNSDLILNIAAGILCVCAVVVTGIQIKREFFDSPPSSEMNDPVIVEKNWRSYAASGYRMGPSQAQVTIVEFSDFQCPFCRELTKNLKSIRQKYPKDVAIVFRNFPLRQHPFALAAARAADCAAHQGKFEAFHDELFSAQHLIGTQTWKAFAFDAGVPDSTQFRHCIQDSLQVSAIDRDTAAADRLGVTGTPTILVNQYRLSGVASVVQLDKYVRLALNTTRN